MTEPRVGEVVTSNVRCDDPDCATRPMLKFVTLEEGDRAPCLAIYFCSECGALKHGGLGGYPAPLFRSADYPV